MKKTLVKIFNFVDLETNRTKKVKKNMLISSAVKILNMFLGFLYFPIALNYLDKTKFGIFTTLISIMFWFSYFDIGIGQGLRNKLAEAFARKNYSLARTYISTAYFYFSFIVIGIIIILLCINYFINWATLLNISSLLESELKALSYFLILGFFLKFFFGLTYKIFLSLQLSMLVEIFNLFEKAFILFAILVLQFFISNSLLAFGIVNSFIYFSVPLLATVLFFNSRYSFIAPSANFVKKNYSKNLISLGLKFFFIQIALVIIQSLNNIMISNLINVEIVTSYNIAFKYFNTILVLFQLVNTPLWSAYTEAAVKKDYCWIRKILKKMLLFWCSILLLVVFMVMVSKSVYTFWIGPDIHIPYILSISVALLILINTWIGIFNFFINGIGKIRIQLITTIIAATLYIPLVYLYVRVFYLGAPGVILASVTCLALIAIVSPIQTILILNNRAKGVWNK